MELKDMTVTTIIAMLIAESRPGHASMLCVLMAMIAGRHVPDDEVGRLAKALTEPGLGNVEKLIERMQP